MTPTTSHAEVSMASVVIALGLGKLMEVLIAAEPVLEAISYIVAIIAGIITIYYKIKKKG